MISQTYASQDDHLVGTPNFFSLISKKVWRANQAVALAVARSYLTPSAPYEKSKSLGSGGSMVARLKLKGIDGRAPPGVELAAQFDSTRENLPGPDIVRIDRLIALS